MPINVIAKLEAISGYRHLNKGIHRRPDENPVAYAHQRVNLSGRWVSVISRVADYGTDYSGRPTNKLAHHVALDEGEHPPAGPAWLMRQRSVFRAEWLGQCETPSTGPVIPKADQPPRICSAWKTVAGDAGWGGVVAEAVASGSAEPLWVIYSLDYRDRILELVDEAISLLPPAMRWRATFNTFAANIPPDVECKLRFVPAASDEARFAASAGHTIDLTKQPSITTASIWVERARGVIRPDLETPSRTREAFNAVQDSAEQESVQSAWSSEDEMAEPPPTPTPPLLPDELNGGAKRRPLWIAAAVVFAVLLLAGAWTLPRYLSGLPLLPGAADPTPQPQTPEPQVVTETKDLVVDVVEPPPATLIFPLHYDQKQWLATALAIRDPSSPQVTRSAQVTGSPQVTGPAQLPGPIELRGSVRLPAVEGGLQSERPAEEPSTTVAPSTRDARSVAWGDQPASLGPPETLRLETTKLTESAATLEVERMPDVPLADLDAMSAVGIVRAEVYWSRAGGSLVARFALDRSVESGALAGSVAAYHDAAVQMSRLADRIESLADQTEHLPDSMRNVAQSFLLEWGRGTREARVARLMRTSTAGSELAAKARQLVEQLGKLNEDPQLALDKAQQAALLRMVSDCGQVEVAAGELLRSLAILRSGVDVDGPELKFVDASGRTLRWIPIRFHFSL